MSCCEFQLTKSSNHIVEEFEGSDSGSLKSPRDSFQDEGGIEGKSESSHSSHRNDAFSVGWKFCVDCAECGKQFDSSMDASQHHYCTHGGERSELERLYEVRGGDLELLKCERCASVVDETEWAGHRRQCRVKRIGSPKNEQRPKHRRLEVKQERGEGLSSTALGRYCKHGPLKPCK